MGLYVEGLGVNWGTQATHQLPPETVVHMLKDNGIKKKVKLFDADDTTMSALAGSGIEVMVAIPNNQLAVMNDYKRAQQWVKKNAEAYLWELPLTKSWDDDDRANGLGDLPQQNTLKTLLS
uniref:glucan endo-1,3-beta-D-glucosidase n=1 Tax=Cicer arietinum TaxID=3827 RepID=A0A089WUG7_CICAR|nr:glucanase [Cicer arietinum]